MLVESVCGCVCVWVCVCVCVCVCDGIVNLDPHVVKKEDILQKELALLLKSCILHFLRTIEPTYQHNVIASTPMSYKT
jgi:hypothetical protein